MNVITVVLTGGEKVVARFDPTDDTSRILLYADDDLAEISEDQLLPQDRALILEAVGVYLVASGIADVPAAWIHNLMGE